MDKCAKSSIDEKYNEANLRQKIDIWRSQRYERLTSRLLRNKMSNGSSHPLSPSILGVKCPKHALNAQVFQRNSAFSDVDVNLNSGGGVVKKIKKGPVVRQTATSRIRMIQNNPFAQGGEYDNLRKEFGKENIREEFLAPISSTPFVEKSEDLAFPTSISAIKINKDKSSPLQSKKCLKFE